MAVFIQKRYAEKFVKFKGEINDGPSKLDIGGFLPTEKLLKSYMLAGKNLVDYRTRVREGLVTSNVNDDIDPRDYAEPVGRSADMTDVSVALRRIERLAEEALANPVPPVDASPPTEPDEAKTSEGEAGA